MPYCYKIVADILSADQGGMREYRAIMREGLEGIAAEDRALERRLGKERLSRFDNSSYQRTRQQVMSRGRGQIDKSK